jgi:hypothetical protein
LVLLILDPQDPEGKSIKILSYPWFSSPNSVSIQRYPLTDFGFTQLSYPHLLTVDRSKMELAFLDITDSRSQIYKMNYYQTDTGYSLRPGHSTFDIGLEAPTFLKFFEDGLGFNDNQGRIQRVRQLPSGIGTGAHPNTSKIMILKSFPAHQDASETEVSILRFEVPGGIFIFFNSALFFETIYGIF